MVCAGPRAQRTDGRNDGGLQVWQGNPVSDERDQEPTRLLTFLICLVSAVASGNVVRDDSHCTRDLTASVLMADIVNGMEIDNERVGGRRGGDGQ